MNRPIRYRLACRLVAAVTFSGSAWAAPPAQWIALDAVTLAKQRGGFVAANGLTLALGIDRLVSINGATLERTSINIADVGSISASEARAAGAALSTIKLIQNGGANIDRAGFSNASLGATVIQNTLSDQHIDSRTVISASVNSLDLLATWHFHGNVSDAVARAARP